MRKILLTLTVLYLCLTTNAQLSNGLVCYFPFNGNAADASGHNHNGIVKNAVLAPDRFGVANHAYSFNGTNAIIEIADHSDFHMPNFTISAWLNISQVAQSFVSKAYGSGYFNSFDMAYESYLEGVFTDGASQTIYLSTSSLLSTWVHCVMSFDDTHNEVKFYKNGVLVSTIPTNLTVAYDNSIITIGGEYNNGTLAYMTSGSIDEVRIYNRVLSQSEIDTLSNSIELCNGLDDDGDGLIDETCVPTVSITGKNIDEGNSNTTDLKFTVTLSNDFENDVTVKYKTKNNTATAGSDYVAAESKVKFKPGQKSKKITIDVFGDLIVEPNEEFYVILSNPVNAVLGTDTAVGKIKNDDASFSKSAKTVTDKIVKNELQINVFPNPVKNIITISGLKGNNIPMEITDMLGKPMIKQTVNEGGRINISTLRPGSYIIKFSYPGALTTVKFIKQ